MDTEIERIDLVGHLGSETGNNLPLLFKADVGVVALRPPEPREALLTDDCHL